MFALADQALGPAALVARSWTSYSVPLVSEVMSVGLVTLLIWVQLVVPVGRWRRS